MKRQFEYIYAKNLWEHGSGEGSLPVHTRGYVRFLQRFLRRRRIRSVADFGCGDWQFSRLIDWGEIEYRGYDIVAPVIEANRMRYQNPRIGFEEIVAPYTDIAPADLFIAKDVFQHWSDDSIFAFLPTLAKFRIVLIVNCVDPSGPTKNLPILDGGFRYLDMRLSPFDLPAEEVFSFTNHRSLMERLSGPPRWLKKVLLLEGDSWHGRSHPGAPRLKS
jgi:hypothetical protein